METREGTTIALEEHPALFGKLEQFGVLVRVIHHVRHPYDNIGSICRRYGRSVEEATDVYFERAASVRRHLRAFEDVLCVEVIETHHEGLIRDTLGVLSALLDFVGLAPTAGYLEACPSVVFDAPVKSREKVSWPQGSRERVAEAAQRFPFLRGYSFD